jgi:hypothetical protein
MGAGNQTQVLCKSSRCSSPPSHLCSPVGTGSLIRNKPFSVQSVRKEKSTSFSSSSPFLLVLCVWACEFVCDCGCVHTCMCSENLGWWCWCLPPSLSTLLFETGSLTESGISLIWLTGLTSKLPGSTCPPALHRPPPPAPVSLFHSGILWLIAPWVLESQFKSLSLPCSAWPLSQHPLSPLTLFLPSLSFPFLFSFLSISQFLT